MKYNNNNEMSFCKKCGCELTSTNKRKLCDNCRRERFAKVKKGAKSFVGLAGTAVLVLSRTGIPGSGKKS